MTTLEDIFGLRGRRALLTGGSSGLGVDLATALAIAGADVALVARRAERLAAVAEKISQYGIRVATLPADLAEIENVEQVVERAEEALGPIDVLVNNAGISDGSRAEKTPLEVWRRVLDLNVTLAFRLSQEVAKRIFAREGTGRIVNVSSILDARASSTPGLAAYAASKAALTNLTRQMATEWATRGITVNALCPGYFPTELNDEALAVDAIRDRLLSFTPMGRFGVPGELNAALLFLLSPGASYVTGASIHVDGGYRAW